jgi:O-antigen ligase
MTNNYNFSRSFLLKKIGMSPGKKLLVFFISAVLITIPLGYAYNSLAIILFVAYSFISGRKEDFSFGASFLLPMLFFILMSLSLTWSLDFNSTLRALSKEAAFLFIPLAFCFSIHHIKRCVPAILKNLSVAMCLFGIYFLGRALMRYNETGNINVFFYNELATPVITSVYLSALFSIAFFYFLSVQGKSMWSYIGVFFTAGIILLLLHKVVIIADVVMIAVYISFFSNIGKKARIMFGIGFIALAAVFVYYAKTNNNMPAEYVSNLPEMETLAREGLPVNEVSVHEAWHKPVFNENDYFNGSVFRVYQIRIFKEMMTEDPAFFTGYGLNASTGKIENKAREHNVFEGGILNHRYSRQNFHNQYIETFADLGVVGFLLLIAMLGINLKNALTSKDFTHIAFGILMIVLLLTESFLWRQRGVVLFVMLYCLFNGILLKGNDKEKYEKSTNNRSGGFFGVAPM